MSLSKSTVALLFMTTLLFGSGIPVEDMGIATLGVEYRTMISGQTILDAALPTEFRAFYFLLHYAPVPYVLISGGAGGAQFSITTDDSLQYNSFPRISPSGGINLFTPQFFRLVTITIGTEAFLLSSSKDRATYTNTLLLRPSAGVRFQTGSFGSLEAGLVSHVLQGRLEEPASEQISVAHPLRWYASLNLHAKKKAGYFIAAIDASPAAAADWSNGPDEASFSLQIGFLLKQKSPDNDKNGHKNGFWGGYDTMKKNQDTIADDLKKRK